MAVLNSFIVLPVNAKVTWTEESEFCAKLVTSNYPVTAVVPVYLSIILLRPIKNMFEL